MNSFFVDSNPYGPQLRPLLQFYDGQPRVNQLGGWFVNGKSLPHPIRLKIVEMGFAGVRPCQISRELRVSHGCVSKILSRYQATGSLRPGISSPKKAKEIPSEVKEAVEKWMEENSALSCRQIRDQLIESHLCHPRTAPSLSAVTQLVRQVCLKRDRAIRMRKSDEDQHLGNEKTESFPKNSISISKSISNSTSISNSESTSNSNSIHNSKSISNSNLATYSISNSNSRSKSNSNLISNLKTESENKSNEEVVEKNEITSQGCLGRRRWRTTFTANQIDALERAFAAEEYLDGLGRKQLADEIGLSEIRVQVWFSNRRAKKRRLLKDRDRFGKHLSDQLIFTPSLENQTVSASCQLLNTATFCHGNNLAMQSWSNIQSIY